MNKYGKLINSNTIQFTRLLPGSIEQVWSYLVESDKRAKWLASGNTELKVNGRVEFNFENTTLSKLPDEQPSEKYADIPEKVDFHGKVTHCSPPNRLSFIWPGEDEDSEVTFELEEHTDGVLFTVTHSRITNQNDLLSTSAGWHTHLDIMVAVLNKGQPQPFWRIHNELELEYKELFKDAELK